MDETENEEPTKQVAPEPYEFFRYGSITWNVDKAREIVAEQPVSLWIDPVKVGNAFLDSEKPIWSNADANGVQSLLSQVGIVKVNPQIALSDQTDLTEPLIALPGKFHHMIITGWNAIYKARHIRLARLPVIVLTEAQELEVRASPLWVTFRAPQRQTKPVTRVIEPKEE